ncbi:MAG: efflux RND transporter periplasmic adaptor subunit [Pseudomonadota bacterium]
MSNKTLFPVLVLAACIAIAAYLGSSEQELASIDVEPYAPSVRVQRVQSTTEFLSVSSQGTVQPRTQSELIPEVSGQVTWLSPSLIGGGAFEAGEILLRIDDADYVSAALRSRAVLERTVVEEEFAADELERLQSLFSRNLASQSQLDSARRSARVAAANLLEARAAVEQAERDLTRTEIRAPFEGLVRAEQVDVGQFVSRGSSIATIYATDFMEVRLPIAADQLSYLDIPVNAQGMIPEARRPEVTLSANFGEETIIWEGRLVRSEAEIDERSRMIFGVTRIDNDTGANTPTLPVGLFVQADIRGREVEGVVRLPRAAMRDNQQLLIVDDDNRLRFRNVHILRLEQDDVLIDRGLTDGEFVCVSPLQTVVEGMPVKPVVE